ncbi:hypothetical protein RLIN73S_02765 [Rhodanobacter lindaniclasticus]
MLLKPFQTVVIPSVSARAGRAADLWCHTQGGGSSSGSTPSPGQRCVTVTVYGPPSPTDGQPTIIGTRTVCT